MFAFDSRKELPSFWTIQLVGWLVYLAAIYITFLTVAAPDRFGALFYIKAVRTIIGFFLTSVFLRPVYRRFGDRLAMPKLLLIVLLCVVMFGCAWALLESGYFFLLEGKFDAPNFIARFPRLALDYAMTLTAWSALYLGIKNWLAWQKERENALRSSALAQTAQLEMLRYQLNPHFLFNALNSIRASVDEDAHRAKEMITRLSEFLRFSLLGESEKKIFLREELEAVRNYLAIEKIRFEDKLTVSFEVGKAAEDFKVPCFLLNPLVENAVKHGLQTSAKPLKINVSAKISDCKLILEVSNSGRLQNDSNGNGTKIGLKNVRERLAKLFGERGRFALRQDGDFVRARIEIDEI